MELPKSSNYPRHARAYVDYCLQKGGVPDASSFAQYTTDLPPNRVSPIRKFMLFYQRIGQPRVVPDPKPSKIPPTANDLIQRFIQEAKTLQGERSRQTYTKALTTFFAYMNRQQQMGKPASLSGLTVTEFVHHLLKENYSPFTINLYLSAVKQLAIWCIGQREALMLTEIQLSNLGDIKAVRGLTIDRRTVSSTV
ncbi:phage integrase N-terminal SAM-like domain-containing protein [Larkinella arboricola]|uniref:phage integrase N-terminal SAM-like domain-containing protein n=1 Tax=Larkinella arboricola TaxID=643671 RepID=UPI001E3346A6|nr:phage integrase N-terminal SAM-like domain-containing protein [Larkinella arboricola]